jgi:hypothetical protein
MENQVSFEDIKQLFKETDRKLSEQMAQSRAEAERSRAEAERSRAEFDRRFLENERYLNNLGKRFGDLGNRLGEFVEGMVRPGLVRLFRERGLELHQTFRDMSARQGKEAAQIDLMAIDETVAVAVEVKSRLTVEAVDEHLRRMEKFRRLFPRFADLRVLGAVAAMVIDDEAAAYAEEKGLFVIGQSGDDAMLLNTPEFEPRGW